MKVFFDTSVLVASCVPDHPHYTRARPVFERVGHGVDEGCMSAHSVAETYAVLTRLPVTPRIQPWDAALILKENMLPYFEIIQPLNEDYWVAVDAMAGQGLSGAKIYDLLLMRCAARSGAERIYTFNITDFKAFAPTGLQEKIGAP